ncbi:MAG: hypothetical protein A2381_03055 [Bdellovibrionales bacterium RIFOXYB1_FULL_37_110]|nr:MAG: hypothetical protein A2181_03435 [Bdellovibrionales bacterium RIFOXYA1_FULL_38_20]OFZ51484.1 MAG: hypothetical protein A2417_09510 [Bdellovibrionales bacterium RIFOXYC1_FULL_37_79]OFZ57912.1 MAG: hypothetical protein A2381_03055 [Bdellovibrionales bacterium RIFOXYB1_FULL_37_110]OFZ63638.1 MAG: hypothetical protein A2577_05355 [Bdellovibrionales bacterium RIFOXYD1_FULL_36_51]
MKNRIVAILVVLVALSINVFAMDNENRMENRLQKREEMKASFEKMKSEMKACPDKVCKCEVRKKHLKETLDKLKARVQEMEKKYNEMNCSKEK